ncbi:flagellar biosynthesis protein FlhA [candidate division LCP-89 bacterium B3_LCP]|uniref:Flagellar biosynthesis protein FlhA n=1 Tax=candidate division LCP-89 bacterium B3_LCP TaxID=2012998 RepID=A0A532V4W6_UNCL8|nr:MAG: flagellar biosynthesis protein FlhA [candidate division LCP-89 bacterium B3_LCP]
MLKSAINNPYARNIAGRSDVFLAVGVIGILIVMIIPIPTFLLDLLLALNITLAVVILMVAMYTDEVLSFSVFPGLLLVITLFRLSLNVASTRLILGEAYAGTIIQAFGGYVVAGNYVVGVVIFLILVLINFVVITKGSGRIAEVAARFTLDAMPGKQMAIDADLNNGLIDEEEARERREKITREADFYGAMDGASKFVRGDAMAGLLITAVNIVGGLIIGVLQLKLSASEALSTYTILTVGDGLVAQIPALIISTSAGIIVSRAASESNLGSDLTSQLLQQPRPLFIASGVLAFFAIVPGLPTIPFLVLSGIAGYLGYQLGNAEKDMQKEGMDEASQKAAKREPERIEDYLNVDPLELEIGYGLIPLVDNEQNGDLLSRITLIRKQQALSLGIVIPPIRIRDNIQLKPQQYVIKIRGNEAASGELHMGHFLALNPGTAKGKIEGVQTKEPTYGLPAVWIASNKKDRAENMGYTVVEPAAVLSTHLVEVLKSSAHKILSREDTKSLIDNFKKQNATVVDELVPAQLTYGAVHKVLQKLLKEGIPVRDLGTILETLSDYSSLTKDTDILTEYVRYSLSPAITHKYQDPDGKIYALTLDPSLEKMISEEFQQQQGQKTFALTLPPNVLNQIYIQLNDYVQEMQSQGRVAILVCSPTVRAAMRRLTEPVLPQLSVISYGELLVNAEVESLGMVTLQPQQAEVPAA